MAHILVVDDNDRIANMCRTLLALAGHKVDMAFSGARALDLFAFHNFDLVVTDLEMPEMQGDELANRIKKMKPTVPIIIMSGATEVPTLPMADRFLAKPFNNASLMELVDGLLNE
jgi:CheY-like chemotaxis protein